MNNMNQIENFLAEGLLDYQELWLKRFLADTVGKEDITGWNILEIGGSPPFSVAKTLFNMTQKKVTVVNPWPADPDMLKDGKVHYIQGKLEDIPFGDHFDAIFGIAVTEHISNLDCYRLAYDLLKENGIIALCGGPHWLSHHGHHICLLCDDVYYTFHKNNPIDNYSHQYCPT